MPTLYVAEQGTTVRKDQNRLVVERDGRVLASIHDFKIERVVVFGNVQVTTQAMALLMDRGIDTAFISLAGRLKGRLVPIASKNVTLRLNQYERSRDRDYTLSVARAIVAAKIANCIQVLFRYQRHRADAAFAGEAGSLTRLRKEASQARSIDSLRGLEGQAAAVYFDCFGRLLRRGFEFDKRTRRPPKDPINAMLGFGYALLYNEAISAVSACGFDPYVGFYHSVRYGRCSLALDLMEEMRPLTVDRLVLYLANTETIGPGRFRRDEGSVLLDSEARKRFLAEYEQTMGSEFTNHVTGKQTSLRLSLYEQAQRLVKSVMNQAGYNPFQGWR
jgi:CRISPR-associated protein Cas1